MAKYAMFFTYTSDAWARMINSPGDRSAAARQMVEAARGTLECIYWMLGKHDGLAIVDLPDSVGAAAVNLAVTSSGSFTSNEAYELLTQAQLDETFARGQGSGPCLPGTRPGQLARPRSASRPGRRPGYAGLAKIRPSYWPPRSRWERIASIAAWISASR